MEELKKEIIDALNNVIHEAWQKKCEIEGDYLENGLVHCGKCHTPKECVISIMGKEQTVPCLCQCGEEQRNAEEQKVKDDERKMRLFMARTNCFESKHLWKYTFENCNIKNDLMYKTAVKYVENFDTMKEAGQGLLYYGSIGYGKTYIAASIANALIDKGFSCYMGSMASISALMYDNDSKRQFLKEIKEYDLLIIDDLGAERDTSYMNEIVYLVIDRRYHAHLPTIITTNMTGDELRKPTDSSKKRVMSRLYEMCLFVEVNGKDRRRMECKENYEKYRDLLGLPGKE